MRTLRCTVLVLAGLASSSCASVPDRDAVLVLDSSTVTLDLPVGWNPTATVINMEGFEADRSGGMDLNQAWRKNFIRSDERGFFSSRQRWHSILAEGKETEADAVEVVSEPHLELTVSTTTQGDQVRVEFRGAGTPKDGGRLVLRGASLGTGKTASQSIGLASADKDEKDTMIWRDSCLERRLGEASVTVRALGDAPAGKQRRWAIRQRADGGFDMFAVDVRVQVLK